MSQFLNKGYKKKIENYKSVSHAFRKKHSIETNAYIHKNKRYVFNIDLKDFFLTLCKILKYKCFIFFIVARIRKCYFFITLHLLKFFIEIRHTLLMLHVVSSHDF